MIIIHGGGLQIWTSRLAGVPFAVSRGGRGGLVETLFDRTTGTNIGDMTADGGLAAAFDGEDTESFANCANRNNTNSFIGKTLTASFPISKIIAYGSSDFGFTSGGNPSIDFKLYAKSGAAPANGTDGTLLGTDTQTDSNGLVVTVTSGDTSTAYDHVWLYYASGVAQQVVGELKIYVMA